MYFIRPSTCVILISLLSLQVYAQGNNSTRVACLKEEFSCHDGTCIPDNLLCNGNDDCSNGLDEVVCISRPPFGCPANDWQCGNNTNECIPLSKVCDGKTDCFPHGEDENEMNCPKRNDSKCLVSEFECVATNSSDQNTTCIPLTQVCDCNTDCANNEDEVHCDPFTVTSFSEPEIVVEAGTSVVTLLCNTTGYPTPTVTWLNNLMELKADPRFMVISKNGMGILIIKNITVFDKGIYTCVVDQRHTRNILFNHSTNLNVTSELICSGNDRNYVEGDSFYKIETILTNEAKYAAADVTFIVDESSSTMDVAHEWVRDIVPKLDAAFKDFNVGIGNLANKFALVGFGGTPKPEGRVLSQLTSVEQFINATYLFEDGGTFEDGYSGIYVALSEIKYRNNTSIIFVLVTDEDRNILNKNLTRSTLQSEMMSRKIILNSVVNQAFLYNKSDINTLAFGLNYNGTAFVFNTSSSPIGFTTYPNGVKHPIFSDEDTYSSYVELALAVGGAAWHIDQVDLTKNFSVPFSEAFVNAKVEEIVLPKFCSKCDCQRPNQTCTADFTRPLSECKGLVAIVSESYEVKVTPESPRIRNGKSIMLECLVHHPPSVTPKFRWSTLSDSSLCENSATCVGNTITLSNISSGAIHCFVDFEKNGSLVQTGERQSLVTVISPPSANITYYTPVIDLDKRLEIRCEYSGRTVLWKKDGRLLLQTKAIKTDKTTSTLTIENAKLSDSGTYQCIAFSCEKEDKATVTVNVDCTLPGGSKIVYGEHRILLEPAADIVLLVDESGSMSSEHQWIVRMVSSLDKMLKDLNIGNGELANKFGIVGFGSCVSPRVLLSPNRDKFVESSDIQSLTNQLEVVGNVEDGYAAIKRALDEYSFRNGARQFILISDEERDIAKDSDPSLNRSFLLDQLKNHGVILNAVISQSFESKYDVRALGIDHTNKSYIFDPLSGSNVFFSSTGRTVDDSAYMTTNYDYTQLALQSGGAAWDLNLLRQGGNVSDAFTEAFVEVKVEEIVNQIKCENCSCNENGVAICVPITSGTTECNVTKAVNLPKDLSELDNTISVTVTPQTQTHIDRIGDGTLTCSIQNSKQGEISWIFNGGLLPNDVSVFTTNTMSKLTMSPVTEKHSGIYSCIVRSNAETGTARGIVDVASQTLYNLTVYPKQARVATGSSHSLLCSADEPNNFRWEFNYASLPDNVFVTFQNDKQSRLNITKADSKNTGRYICIVDGGTTGLQSSSDAIVYVYDPLSVSTEKTNYEVSVGAVNVSIICKLNCCPGANVSWTRQYASLPSNAKTILSNDGMEITLLFSTVTLSNCDLYICKAEKGNIVTSTSIHLNVREPLKAVLRVPRSNCSETQTIICHALNHDNLNVTFKWSHNGVPITLPYAVSPLTYGSLLKLRKVSEADNGLYTCTVSNSNGDVAKSSTSLQINCGQTSVESSSTAVLLTSTVSPSIAISNTISTSTSTIGVSSPVSTSTSTIAVPSPVSTSTSTVGVPSPVSTSTSTIAVPSPVSTSTSTIGVSSPVSTSTSTVGVSSPVSTSTSTIGVSSPVSTSTSTIAVPSPVSTSTSTIAVPSPVSTSTSTIAVSSTVSTSTSTIAVSSTVSTSTSTIAVPSPVSTSTSTIAVPSPVSTSTSTIAVSSTVSTSTSTIAVSSTVSTSTSTIAVSPSYTTTVQPTETPKPEIYPNKNPVYLAPSENFNATCHVNASDPDIGCKWTYELSNLGNYSQIVIQNEKIKIQSFNKNYEGVYKACSVNKSSNEPFNKSCTPVCLYSNNLQVTVDSDNKLLPPGGNENITCRSNMPVEMVTWVYTPFRNREDRQLPVNTKSVPIPANTTTKCGINLTAGAILVIENFNSSFQGDYQCTATDTYYMSRTRQVQINQISTLSSSLASNSQFDTVTVSDFLLNPIVFTCEVTCTCGGARVDWILPAGAKPPYPVKFIDFTGRIGTLTFNNTRKDLSGEYCCVVTHHNLGSYNNCKTFEVVDKPTVSVTPEEASAPQNSSYTFTCTISNRGTSKVDIDWTFKGDNELPAGVNHTESASNDESKLTIWNVQSNINTGLYHCNVFFRNTGETITDTGSLSVLVTDARVSFKGSQNYKVGEKISVECELKCSCVRAIKWSHNGNNFDNGLSYQLDFTQRIATLQADSATVGMSGTYTCELRQRGQQVIEYSETFTITVS